jgi:uncharacterized protein YcaQ
VTTVPAGAALEISRAAARRAAVRAQGLLDPVPKTVTDRRVLEVIRRLGYVQLDPTNVVDRSQHLVLYSRLGPFDRSSLDRLQRESRTITEYWAHAASIVPSEDFAAHLHLAEHSVRGPRVPDPDRLAWQEENSVLRDSILARLAEEGALPSGAFEDDSERLRDASGWSMGRNADRMLHYLWLDGVVNVSHRSNGRRHWVRTDGWYPPETRQAPESPDELTARFALRTLGVLGVATARHVREYMSASQSQGTDRALDRAVEEGNAIRVAVPDVPSRRREVWYAPTSLRKSLERPPPLRRPRATLLSPFDNLITNRARTECLFGFHYRIEIYTPKRKRRFGYYSLPVLYGDRLVGRVDPVVDRARRRLTVRAAHAEPNLGDVAGIAPAVQTSVEKLAAFVGAVEVRVTARRGAGWTEGLKSARLSAS